MQMDFKASGIFPHDRDTLTGRRACPVCLRVPVPELEGTHQSEGREHLTKARTGFHGVNCGYGVQGLACPQPTRPRPWAVRHRRPSVPWPWGPQQAARDATMDHGAGTAAGRHRRAGSVRAAAAGCCARSRDAGIQQATPKVPAPRSWDIGVLQGAGREDPIRPVPLDLRHSSRPCVLLPAPGLRPTAVGGRTGRSFPRTSSRPEPDYMGATRGSVLGAWRATGLSAPRLWRRWLHRSTRTVKLMRSTPGRVNAAPCQFRKLFKLTATDLNTAAGPRHAPRHGDPSGARNGTLPATWQGRWRHVHVHAARRKTDLKFLTL